MTDRFENSNSSIRSNCSDLSEPSRNVIINERWKVLGKIGEGSFGEVFEGQDLKDGKIYAIKRERKSMRHPQLKRESEYYQLLGHGPGIPQCHWYGEFDEFNCIVLDLLGPSLKDIRQSMTPMPFDIIVELICQMVDIVHHVHCQGLVFRDIKPDNFLFAKECKVPEIKMVKLNPNEQHYEYEMNNARTVFDRWGQDNIKLYIIDFGLATFWRDTETDKPLPEAKPKRRNKIGTARYASINVHRGRMHARRDDLEGIAYILLDLVLGTLPWTGIQARNSAAGWDRMRVMKTDAYMPELLDGYPEGLVKFIDYTRKLKFAEDPNYELLKQFLRGSLPTGKYSKPTRSPFEKGANAEPRQPHRLAADMTLYFVDQHQKGDLGLQGGKQSTMKKTTIKESPLEENGSNESVKSKNNNWGLDSKKVGWYTYKHDEEPWEPEIDWEQNDGDKQANNISWGEDNPNASWGPSKDEPIVTKLATNENGWPSSVIRTDSGTGWDCMPSSQENNKGESMGTTCNKPDRWGNESINTTHSWATTMTANTNITPSNTWGSKNQTFSQPDNTTNNNNNGWGNKATDTNSWAATKAAATTSNTWGSTKKPPQLDNNICNEKNGWGVTLEPQSTWESMQKNPPIQQQQRQPYSNNARSSLFNNKSSNTCNINHHNDKKHTNDTAVGTDQWNTWAANHSGKNQPSGVNSSSSRRQQQQQQQQQQQPVSRSGSTNTNITTEPSGWNNLHQHQQQDDNDNNEWVSTTGQDGWTKKVSHRHIPHHRGRRKQHW